MSDDNDGLCDAEPQNTWKKIREFVKGHPLQTGLVSGLIVIASIVATIELLRHPNQPSTGKKRTGSKGHSFTGSVTESPAMLPSASVPNSPSVTFFITTSFPNNNTASVSLLQNTQTFSRAQTPTVGTGTAAATTSKSLSKTGTSRISETIVSPSVTPPFSETNEITATVSVNVAGVNITVYAKGAAKESMPNPVELFNGPISCDYREQLYKAITEILPDYGFSDDECQKLYVNTTQACEKLNQCMKPETTIAVGNATVNFNVTNGNSTEAAAFFAMIQAGCNLPAQGVSAKNQARFLRQAKWEEHRHQYQRKSQHVHMGR